MTLALKGYEIGLIIGGIILFVALCALAVIFILKSKSRKETLACLTRSKMNKHCPFKMGA